VSRGLSEAALDWVGFDFPRVLVLVALFTLVALVGGVVYVGLQLADHHFLVTRLYVGQVGDDSHRQGASGSRSSSFSTYATSDCGVSRRVLHEHPRQEDDLAETKHDLKNSPRGNVHDPEGIRTRPGFSGSDRPHL
jgi:hypothetical protein